MVQVEQQQEASKTAFAAQQSSAQRRQHGKRPRCRRQAPEGTGSRWQAKAATQKKSAVCGRHGGTAGRQRCSAGSASRTRQPCGIARHGAARHRRHAARLGSASRTATAAGMAARGGGTVAVCSSEEPRSAQFGGAFTRFAGRRNGNIQAEFIQRG